MGASSVVRPLRAVIMFGLVFAGLNLAGAARVQAANCRPGWDVQPPNVGSGANQLNGVAATSVCNAWAVGVHSNNLSRTQRTLIEQWDGNAWEVHRSPSPGRSNGSELSGVAATSSGPAWAVGYYFNGTSNRTLIEHWNGRSWKVQPSPNPGGPANDNQLSAVAAASATDAWAVGNYYDGMAFHILILHWNGRKWKAEPSAAPGRSKHINGGFLRQRATVGLTGVTATSSKNAWAVGFQFDGTADQTLIEHWNGRAWKAQPSPNPSGSTNDDGLSAVSATSSTNAWAVGEYFADPMAPERTLVEHWNGRRWKVQTSPNPGGSSGTRLSGVAATSSTNAWAVGQYANVLAARDPALVERWNGKRWRVQPSLNLGPSSLFGVSATSPTNAWAVGDYFNGNNNQTLALHCC